MDCLYLQMSPRAPAPITLGSVGQLLNADLLMKIVKGAPVVIDTSVLEKVTRNVPKRTEQAEISGGTTFPGDMLGEQPSRAIVAAILASILNAAPGQARPEFLQFLAGMYPLSMGHIARPACSPCVPPSPPLSLPLSGCLFSFFIHTSCKHALYGSIMPSFLSTLSRKERERDTL